MIGASARDTALVARFEIVRAVRTWRALALVVLYLVATAGGARIFVDFLSSLENRLAETLGVPPTDHPGAMTARLLEEVRRGTVKNPVAQGSMSSGEVELF